jgi:hypothetical protein
MNALWTDPDISARSFFRPPSLGLLLQSLRRLLQLIVSQGDCNLHRRKHANPIPEARGLLGRQRGPAVPRRRFSGIRASLGLAFTPSKALRQKQSRQRVSYNSGM